jgi:hypothetical protein
VETILDKYSERWNRLFITTADYWKTLKMSSFYVTLPSNASLLVHPRNTLTEFRVELPVPIQLDGKYEVALHSLQYTRSWNNVKIGENRIKFSVNGVVDFIDIEIGHYEQGTDLIDLINLYITRQLSRLARRHERIEDYLKVLPLDKFIYFFYQAKSRHVTLFMQPCCHIEMSEKLAKMLGFDNFIFTSDSTVMESPRYITLLSTQKKMFIVPAEKQLDLEQGLYALYIYCDIISHQIVGDTLAPLLKVVPVEGSHGANVMKEYITPQYMAVFTNQFSNINISIRDDSGEKIPFERGRVTATLHFRRQSEI